MTSMILTKSSMFIIGPVASLLGYLMDAIYNFLDLVGIPNIGLSIILFTLIIYLLLTPLTYKQQKFSRMQTKMMPEIQAIQKKYEGKRDNESAMKMNEETKMVYEKYGVSPSGSCVQLLIQMPILLALYQVVYRIPAYVDSVKNIYLSLVNKMMSIDGIAAYMQEVGKSKGFGSSDFTGEGARNAFVDVLNKFSSSDWNALSEKFPDLSGSIASTTQELEQVNNFLGLNIGNSPSDIMSSAWAAGSFLLVLGAIMIPVLSALTQWVNVQLSMAMSEANKANGNKQQPGTNDQMMASMKMMNNVMPIMSAFMCFTLPSGLGIYWICGAVIRSVQQVVINRILGKVDMDELIAKNMEKAKEKREKMGIASEQLINNANANTKRIQTMANGGESSKQATTQAEREEKLRKANEYYKNASKNPNSLAAKANMVKQFEEKSKKK